MRLVVDKARRAEVHLLAALGDHDDAWMVRRLAWRGWGTPPMEAYAGNFGYPILFLADEGRDLARQFCSQIASRVCFYSVISAGVFHILDLNSPSQDSRLKSERPSIFHLARGIGNEQAESGYQ